MRFLQRTLPLLSAITLVLSSSSAAMAHGLVGTLPMDIGDNRAYSGGWPVTISHAARGNGTYCLTLKDNGTGGARHSGPASLTGNGSNQPFGTFLVISHILVATIQQPGGYQNAALLFIGPADNGNIGKGIFEQVYGGEDSDVGELVFGMRGGC